MLKVARQSALAKKVRERRARSGFVAVRPGAYDRWREKRVAQRGFVPTRLSAAQRVGLGVLVVTAAATFVTVRIAFREKETVAVRPVLTTAPTTTTTTAPPTTAAPTTTVPFDDPDVCRARDLVMQSSSSLSADQGRDGLIEGLASISSGLDDLIANASHPELSTAAEAMKPVVDEALETVSASSPEDLAQVAANPRFAEPAFLSAIDTIFGYQLNCAPA